MADPLSVSPEFCRQLPILVSLNYLSMSALQSRFAWRILSARVTYGGNSRFLFRSTIDPCHLSSPDSHG
eukprot:4900093-Pleurochrysis_carterae.AAC.1